MKPAPFSYYAPTTVADAVALLSRFASEDGRVIAGGQSLLPMMAFRLARPRHVIDINGIRELGTLAVEGGRLSIGATVRHAAFETPLAACGPLGRLLAEVARSIAHPPIRSRGTFCGSVANSDPASEWCLVTVGTDAEIRLQSARGTRTVPARGFYSGAMTNALAADELVVSVQIPLLADDTRFGFYEVSRRAGDFAMAAALVTYRVAAGRIVDPKIAIGGVEPFPARVATGEAALTGQVPGGALFRQAAIAGAVSVEPMDDDHMPASYRRELAEAVVERALERSLA
jgi:carbon-monoxide dehydrogenase medium subunit